MTRDESLGHKNPMEGFCQYMYNSVSTCRGILDKYHTKYNSTIKINFTARKMCELSNSLNLTLW